MTNAAYQPTVHWLPELAPSLEGREAALNTFEQQTGHKPKEFMGNVAVGIWGYLSDDAVLLFRVPEGWTP